MIPALPPDQNKVVPDEMAKAMEGAGLSCRLLFLERTHLLYDKRCKGSLVTLLNVDDY
jgi:hypothetical protein